MTRKLTTILAADVAGYADIMHKDEERGHAAFQICRDLIERLTSQHNGRIFGGAGDSVMAEFSSPIEATRAAIQMQQALALEPLNLPEGCRMQFRMGINIGDVMVDGANLYGDAVDIADRLQSIAEPGGLCISDKVYDYTHNQLRLRSVDMGLQHLKNIVDPVHAYRVIPGVAPRRVRRKIPIPGAIAAAILVVAVISFGFYRAYFAVESSSVMPEGSTRIASHDPPSIAILPFKSLSSNPQHEYLSDGLTNDITTDLSKFSNLLVIASNSSFTYKDKPTKVQDIGRELGAAYLLEGTVEATNTVMRINAQLIDAAGGNHIWAERYDRGFSDVLAVQDEIARSVVTALAIKVSDAELKRVSQKGVSDLSAYESWLKGRATLSDPEKQTKEGNEEARQFFLDAIKRAPMYARPYGYVSYTHVQDWQNEWSDDPDRSLEMAFDAAKMALELNDSDYDSHWSMAIALVNKGPEFFDKGMEEYEKALAMNPNDADLLAEMAEPLIDGGRAQQAVDQVREAIRRNPYHPYWYLWTLGRACYFAHQYQDAIDSINRIEEIPADARLVTAASYAQLGNISQAEAEMKLFREGSPDWTIEKSRKYYYKRSEDLEHWLDGLRKAGLPEGSPENSETP